MVDKASQARYPVCGQALFLISDTYNFLAGAWVAGTLDTNQYVEVDMELDYKFTRVHIQGRDGAAEWVTSFKVHYYDAGTTSWVEYTDGTGQNVSFSLRNTINS